MFPSVMSKRVAVVAGVGVVGIALSALGQEPAPVGKPTAEEVARRWSPRLKSVTDFHQMGGSHRNRSSMAAYTFRVVGPTFEELWQHYAGLCGLKRAYEEKTFLNVSETGPNGAYVVSEREAGDRKGGRGPSVFLLRTEDYAVTVTFAPDAGGKSISGSLCVVVP